MDLPHALPSIPRGVIHSMAEHAHELDEVLGPDGAKAVPSAMRSKLVSMRAYVDFTGRRTCKRMP